MNKSGLTRDFCMLKGPLAKKGSRHFLYSASPRATPHRRNGSGGFLRQTRAKNRDPISRVPDKLLCFKR